LCLLTSSPFSDSSASSRTSHRQPSNSLRQKNGNNRNKVTNSNGNKRKQNPDREDPKILAIDTINFNNKNMPPNADPPADATEAELRAHIQHLNENASIQAGNPGPQVVLNKGITNKIAETVLNITWRTEKFVRGEAHKRRLSDKVFVQSGLNDGSGMTEEQFYGLYGSTVLQTLNCKRNYRIGEMKKVMHAYMANHSGEDPPTAAEIKMCSEREIEDEMMDTWLWYCGPLMQAAAGHVDWGENTMYFYELSKATYPDDANKLRVPPSTEAFLLTVYQGYVEMWTKQYAFRLKHGPKRPYPKMHCKQGDTLTDEEKKWRCAYTEPDSGAKTYGGWNHTGLTKFVANRKAIILVRQTQESKDLEARGMAGLRRQDDFEFDTHEDYLKHKKRRTAAIPAEVTPVDDLLSEEV
jgi:hypothetical protein